MDLTEFYYTLIRRQAVAKYIFRFSVSKYILHLLSTRGTWFHFAREFCTGLLYSRFVGAKGKVRRILQVIRFLLQPGQIVPHFLLPALDIPLFGVE